MTAAWRRCERKPDNMAISPAQCRSARTLLSLSVTKLAAAAGVPENMLDEFELERRPLDGSMLSAVQRALEKAGIVLLPQDDVRLGEIA